ncbi:MAG TPA: glycosyltransferase [Polyangia bacterium]|nr:glycosyltransferase [Polyangia bacterium]
MCSWALLALGFTAIAISSTRSLYRRARESARRPRIWPHIALVRPCEGLDPSLAETLRSSVTARYEGPRTIFFCVPSAVDPAYAVIERVRDELVAGGADVRIVVTAIDTPANRKSAQLAVVDAHLPAEAPILVIADSDVQLDDDSLPSLLSALLSDREAGAASAPPIDVSAATAGDRWSAALLSSTPHALLALAALSERSGGVPLLAGALLAVKREALAAVGGFHSLEPYLGEDFELARRLHDAGLAMATSAAPARFTDSGRTLRGIVRRYARWSLVVRRQRPALFATYVMLLGCTPLVVLGALLATAARSEGWDLALACAAALVGARTLLALTLRRCYGVPGGFGRALAAMLAGELLVCAGATQAGASAEVEWRGRRFYVGARGALEPLAPETP